MKTFIIADTHFGDPGILRYEKRPFSSVEQMDEAMIEAWNAQVGEEDLVFHLGDFSVYDEKMNRELLAKLKGNIILIIGNHDKEFTPQQWRDMGMEEAYVYPVLVDKYYLFSHEPLYVNQEMPYANIFGHVHQNPIYGDVSGHHFCVSCERINYAPYLFEEIKKKILECQ